MTARCDVTCVVVVVVVVVHMSIYYDADWRRGGPVRGVRYRGCRDHRAIVSSHFFFNT